MALTKLALVKRILAHLGRAGGTFLIFGFVFLLIYLRSGPEPPRPQVFAGVVTDKWVSIAESDLGSRTTPVVTIRTDDGRTRNVVVDPENYARLERGMRVRRDLHSVEPVAAP